MLPLVGHGLLQPCLQVEQGGCGLLAGFHTGLVVGVHVHQFAVQAHGTLEQGDQGPKAGGIEALQRDAEVEAPLLGEGRAGALQEAIQEVAGVLPLQGRDVPRVLQHFNEGHEEVVDAIAQLLHVGVLVGGALVAVDGQTLVHHLAIAVELLAEALHHQLLQVAAEHLQAVAVGQHHHVPLATPIPGPVPGGRQQGGGVVAQVTDAGGGIHGSGPGEERTDVAADQDPRKQAHGTGDAGAPPHPIEHVEAGQPIALLRLLIQAAAEHGHRHRLLHPAATGGLHGPAGLQHADVGLGGPPRLAHHDHQGGAKPLPDGRQGAAHAVGIDVVEEMEGKSGPRILQGTDHQQGAQARSADADPQDIGERLIRGGRDHALQHIAAKGFDAIHLGANVLSAGGIRGQLGRPQPVVAHLALFIGVGDGPLLEGGHGGKGLLKAGGHGLQLRRIEAHAAHIQPEPHPRVVPEQVAEPLPLALGVQAGCRGEGGHGGRGMGRPGDAIRESPLGIPLDRGRGVKKPSPSRDCVDGHTWGIPPGQTRRWFVSFL